MENETPSEEVLFQNYSELKIIVDTGLHQAALAGNLHEAKGILIEVQQHFRGLKMRHTDREELYNRLQEAFSFVNQKLENEKFEFEYETLENYNELKPLTEDVLKSVNSDINHKELWSSLIDLQSRIKEKKLKREQREELMNSIQEAFLILKLHREEENKTFEREAQANYNRLKQLVEQGLRQAEETHEYKETREFLKKIQGEFRGIKMVANQREELYARLQTAFDVLGKRLDEFFRTKKKNWETRMNFTLARFDADIYELKQSLEKEKENLAELLDQLDIMDTSGKNQPVMLAMQSRVASARKNIELKTSQIYQLQVEREELKDRLEQ